MTAESNGEAWCWIVCGDTMAGAVCLLEVPLSKNPVSTPSLLSIPISFRRACFLAKSNSGPTLIRWAPYGFCVASDAVGVVRLSWALPANDASVANARRCWGESVVDPVSGAAASKILQLPGGRGLP